MKIAVVEDNIQEVALFTDGLQLLALNNENLSVHQPFFTSMFKWLRMATKDVDIISSIGSWVNTWIVMPLTAEQTMIKPYSWQRG